MEYRHHFRQPIDQIVRLIDDGRVIATARAVDMSLMGVGLLHHNAPLRAGQFVDVDFYKPGHPRGMSCSLRAMVIHSTPTTMGLMFATNASIQLQHGERRIAS